ncbi:tRNA (adenosine(37)-N6)-threonylcarbamoyltransferase complex transferase subunit TsaD [Candidatus Comchoanobacter bicostacola]|uniref:tRNA N6-adenosine threonylcarbamoyltransferase n=1 Tax=Candidatus Comchoanobacter bicostacola TaxID=2919598 RepID=A0ABY5DK82_9GAMM|nr:tRNA (adenosine(37)-N6)-threonylcarbamoyltransferase complex transferase subunit TsaD [Candidatus Comchoanobacter bicostacola]UTC24901.1 tRNA (adenosine(37)-N6)-threonylcarbamoyltransferase complex transferase subunit TsaD [Candidatus Comchoanobacter bicostacola]
MEPIVLGIETSCDETAVAIYSKGKLLANIIHSQEQHNEYGGVVPELAAREHLTLLPLVLNKALKEARITPDQLTHIACTSGPGLIGALLVGTNFASGFAKGLNIPLIPINHLEAHLAAPFIGEAFPNEPFITLLISGGHTQIILTHQLGQHQLLGETLDDAAGEAFDKTAKILGLSYPGGPEIEQLAQTTETAYPLPRALLRRKDCMMSFSGVKTAARQAYENAPSEALKAEIANGLQQCIAEQLYRKLALALDEHPVNKLIVSGGVSANSYIRNRLSQSNVAQVLYPEKEHCTDNAAMIAYLGYLRRNSHEPFLVRARWPLESLTPPNKA